MTKYSVEEIIDIKKKITIVYSNTYTQVISKFKCELGKVLDYTSSNINEKKSTTLGYGQLSYF